LAVLVLLTAGCDVLQPSDEIVSIPTPELTATPSSFQNAVFEIAKTTGIEKQVFLGLSGDYWINLGISLLIVLVGTIMITRIVHALLRWVTGFTSNKRDDEFVFAIKGQINLFISVMMLDFATGRLAFIPVNWKTIINQVYFALYVIAITWMLWKLIDLTFIWHQIDTVPEGEIDASESLRFLFKRLLYGLLVIVAITVVLNNFGVNVTILLAVLVLVIIGLFLAAQDTLSDMAYGFILLFDQPFRVGDRIEIQELGTWGDIIDVGARTTRIRTRDNRLVIMPNSIIGKNQVTNYSYPDPHYRVQTEIDIEPGYDPEHVSHVIIEAVLNVEGVLEEKDIDILLIKVGKSGLKFRIRWWIDTYTDANYVFDRVHRVLYTALSEAGIQMSLDAYDLNLFMRSNNIQPGSKPEASPEE
jgi:MscS family membrane protein